MAKTNYDAVATTYDQRYEAGPVGVLEILQSLARRVQARHVLEIGCGTGHWLQSLEECPQRYGVDFSCGMLRKARQKNVSMPFIRAEAGELPFAANCLDFIYCIHAVHHFPSLKNFISEARRVLQPGGVFTIIGMDPHAGEDRWYVYDYFESTLQADLLRYPSTQDLLHIMRQTGFSRADCLHTACLQYDFIGSQVFDDPILKKDGVSQLSLLSQEEFNRGMEKIRKAILSAKKTGQRITFPAHITLPAVVGFVDDK